MNSITTKYLGFGSPLMDMIADVSSELISKYNLQLDATIHGKVSEHAIFTVMEQETEVTYVAGGCSYNTMRIFNFMLQDLEESNQVSLLGSVGDDNWGHLYKKLLTNENINALFETVPNNNTGVCGVFCHNKDRGHITDLGASIYISPEFVNSNWEQLKNVEMVYTELFILKHRKNIVYMLAELCNNDKKLFGFNLPSFYFIETFLEDIKTLIDYADVIFANSAEAVFLAKLLWGLETENVGEIAEKLSKYGNKKNKNKKRVVIITCGPNPAQVSEWDFNTNKKTGGIYPPMYVKEEEIIDANGAGDAFAGGFLSKYVKNKSIDECMQAGHWAAALIIQTRGCQIPEKCEFIYTKSLN